MSTGTEAAIQQQQQPAPAQEAKPVVEKKLIGMLYS